MPTSVVKLAPQVIVLIVALYWSWPFLQPAPKPEPAPAKDPKAAVAMTFTPAVLSPTFPPLPERNPFEFPGAARPKVAKSNKPGSKATVDKAAVEAKGTSLVLGATCIIGDRRLAYINGRVYKEKEAIQGQGEDAAGWVVTDIYPHKVLLSYQGMPLQLNYTNGPTAARDTKPAAAEKTR